MEPTPRARELSEPVCAGLAKLRSAIDRPSFSAAQPRWTFRLALSDHAVMVVLPALLGILRQQAPEVRLEIESKWNSRVESQLDETSIDLALGIMPHLPDRFGKSVLFDDHYVCLMREDHPLATGDLSREGFSSADHVAVRPSLDRARNIDDRLKDLGCPRQVVLNVNQFLAIPAILKETDLIAYMLCSIAEVLIGPGLKIVQVPCAASSTKVILAWSKLRERDAANQWMRRQVVAAVKSRRAGGMPHSG